MFWPNKKQKGEIILIRLKLIKKKIEARLSSKHKIEDSIEKIENEMGWISQLWQQYQDKHNQFMCILTLNQEVAFS